MAKRIGWNFKKLTFMELWLSRIYVSKPILCVVINYKKKKYRKKTVVGEEGSARLKSYFPIQFPAKYHTRDTSV